MLSIENVSLHYGAAQALRSVSLEAKAGEITCVLGRNGVGKTSLLRALAGHQPISAGRILLDGQPLDGLTPACPCPQRDRLRAAGPRDLPAAHGGREPRDRVRRRPSPRRVFLTLRGKPRRCRLDEVFTLFPVLKEMLGRRGGDLSGGQQQQLAIGRAMVTRPRLLVLDEPTEGIQPSIIKDIGRAIEYLKGKGDIAILLVEQYFDFARQLADRFAVMERGAIVMSGDRSALQGDDVRQRLAI